MTTSDNEIKRAGVTTHEDTRQQVAFVDWSDGHTTTGNPDSTHMQALLARAGREGKLTPATKPAQGHTPGPWALSHQLADGFSVAKEIAPNCGRLIPLATVHPVKAWGTTIDENEARANARLIAAAPRMYEAIRDTLDLAQPELPSHIVKQLSAALNAADGGK